MKVETFFEKFELFADAPDAVAKMRELVLHLAVQGKLVPQDPNDESAEEFVRKIRLSKDRLAASRNLKKLKAGLQLDEFPIGFELPNGWCWSRLGDISLAVTSGSRDWAEHYSSDGAIFVRMGNLSRNSYRLRMEKVQHVTPPTNAEGNRTRLEAGDVLISITGEVGLLGLIPDGFGEAYINQHTCLVRLPSELQNRYIPEYFRSPFAQDYFNAPQRGLKNSFRLTDVTMMPIPLPPLAEQKRIVAKVDELMALCDRLEAQQQERDTQHVALSRAALARFTKAPTPANLSLLFHPSCAISSADLRKTILTLAVRGKLVPQDPADEPASQLLQDIRTERSRARKTERYSSDSDALDSSDIQFELDLRAGWEIARLCDLVLGIQTGPFGSSLHQSDYQLGGTPVVNPASLQNGKIVAIDSMAVGDGTLERLEAFKLLAGDIVMARRGEMGRCAVVTNKEHGWLCGTGSLVMRMPKASFAPFLALVIGAPESRSYLGGASVGTTMQNLNQSILSKMPIGVPPLAEQHRIVAKVDELMALVDQLEARLAEARTAAEALLDALVAELTVAN